MGEDACVFCQIVKKEVATQILYESDDVIAFPDIHPRAPVHILVVPKKHIPTFLDITPADAPVLARMFEASQRLVRERGLEKGSYRIYFNGGESQEVMHLHCHLVSGRR